MRTFSLLDVRSLRKIGFTHRSGARPIVRDHPRTRMLGVDHDEEDVDKKLDFALA
jgi:hypothetical protein